VNADKVHYSILQETGTQAETVAVPFPFSGFLVAEHSIAVSTVKVHYITRNRKNVGSTQFLAC